MIRLVLSAPLGLNSVNEFLSSFAPPLLVIAVSTGLAVRFARWIALRRQLLDVPNERSSHIVSTPRLGGASWMPIFLIALGALARSAGIVMPLAPAFFLGATVLYIIGLMDDIASMSPFVRLGVQVTVAGILIGVWASRSGPAIGFSEASTLVAAAVALGWVVFLINIYNFMDGIDGIAGLQALVAGLAWGGIGLRVGAPFCALAGLCLAAGALGFLSLNWPRAKIFLGDAGSTVLGFSFAALPLLAGLEPGVTAPSDRLFAAGIFPIWPFVVDGATTVIRRKLKGENIFRAHRSHLYQRLVVSGLSHRTVTLIYGGLAAAGTWAAWQAVSEPDSDLIVPGATALAIFGLLWYWTIRREAHSVK